MTKRQQRRRVRLPNRAADARKFRSARALKRADEIARAALAVQLADDLGSVLQLLELELGRLGLPGRTLH